jgi:hypothetical protein
METRSKTRGTTTADDLPNEVLANIFAEAKRCEPDGRIFHKLALVCKRWKSVSRSAAEMSMSVCCPDLAPLADHMLLLRDEFPKIDELAVLLPIEKGQPLLTLVGANPKRMRVAENSETFGVREPYFILEIRRGKAKQPRVEQHPPVEDLVLTAATKPSEPVTERGQPSTDLVPAQRRELAQSACRLFSARWTPSLAFSLQPLEALDLSACSSVTNGTIVTIYESGLRLRMLSIEACPYVGTGALFCALQIKGLRVLNASRTDLTMFDPLNWPLLQEGRSLRISDQFVPDLVALSISRCQFDSGCDHGGFAMQLIASCYKLETLDASFCVRTEILASVVHGMSRLKHLNVSGWIILDDLVRACQVPTLETLLAEECLPAFQEHELQIILERDRNLVRAAFAGSFGVSARDALQSFVSPGLEDRGRDLLVLMYRDGENLRTLAALQGANAEYSDDHQDITVSTEASDGLVPTILKTVIKQRVNGMITGVENVFELRLLSKAMNECFYIATDELRLPDQERDNPFLAPFVDLYGMTTFARLPSAANRLLPSLDGQEPAAKRAKKNVTGC